MHTGILVVNKPKGMTSHDVVDIVRRKIGMRKVGHAGTLDPEATGVLILLLGGCTRLFDRFSGYEKEYVATLTLGTKTTSGDLQGAVTETKPFEHVTEEMAREVFKRFLGEQLQKPHMVSAVKHKGARLYDLARQGKSVERTPRTIVISAFELLEFTPPDIRFRLRCSRGTYVRQLAEDVAEAMDCVGHVSSIERTAVGPFRLEQALSLDDIAVSKILVCPSR